MSDYDSNGGTPTETSQRVDYSTPLYDEVNGMPDAPDTVPWCPEDEVSAWFPCMARVWTASSPNRTASPLWLMRVTPSRYQRHELRSYQRWIPHQRRHRQQLVLPVGEGSWRVGATLRHQRRHPAHPRGQSGSSRV